MATTRIRLLAIVLSAASLLGSAQLSAAAIAPTISTSKVRDFTRVSFNWPKKVRFKVKQTGNSVTLTFNESATIDLSAIRSRLKDRLTAASVSNNGKTVRLTFDQPYRIRHFISGTTNGIDIVGTDKAVNPNPPPPPKELPQPKRQAQPKPRSDPATKQASLPTPPQPKAKPQPPASKPTPLAETSPPPAPPPAPPAPTTKAEAAPTPLVPVPAPAPAPEPKPDPQTETAPEEEIAAAPEAVAETEQQAEGAVQPLTEEEMPPEPEETVDAPGVTEATPAEMAPPAASADSMDAFVADDEANDEELDEEVDDDNFADTFAEAPGEEATETLAEDGQEERPPLVPENADKVTPAPEIGNVSVADAAAPGTEPATESFENEQPDVGEMPEHEDFFAKDAAKALASVEAVNLSDNAGKPFVVTTRTLPNGFEIQFPWAQRTATAIFRHNDDIWIIFDAKQDMRVDMLQSMLPATVKSITQIEHPTHSILYMQTDGTLYPQVRRPRYTTEWHVTLSPYRKIPSLPVMIEAKQNLSTPSLDLDVIEFSDQLKLEDPTTGEELLVMPFFKPGQGIYPGRNYVDLDILESSQGLAVVKKSDFAKIKPLRTSVRLTSKDGLILSQNLPELSAADLEAIATDYGTFFPYEKWKLNENESIIDRRRELEKNLLDASGTRVSSLRHKLAEMYLSQGMGHEALALLNMIRKDDISYYYQFQLAALRGAANFLIHRYGSAIADFNAKEISGEEEIKIWLDALAIFQKDRPRFRYNEHYETHIKKYPPRLRERLAILAADNYINRRSYQKSLNAFDTLSVTGISDETMPYINFLLGKIAADQGKLEQAKQMWQPLIDEGEDRFVRARADYALTTLMYNSGEMDSEEAMQRLDKLRIVWRGDAFEVSLLNFVGQLFIDNGRYLDGMRAWRELITNFPNNPVAAPVAREMARTFNALFIDGKADDMEPLDALSLFYEFRELTPIGQAGDIMIQKLADRLAAVDLLDRAAAILEHQIQYRQEGEARSRLGTQLGLIYVLNEEPARAIKALELTGYGKNLPALQRRRQQISAMALAQMKEYNRAIKMLKEDHSTDAKMLKMNIFWQMGDWGSMITTAEDILGSREDVTLPLSRRETELLLQLAIAYAFDSNPSQIQYLRSYFLPLIPDDDPLKEIFSFITESSEPLNPRKLEVIPQYVNSIEDFMRNYREKLTAESLSSILEEDEEIEEPKKKRPN